VKPFPSTIECLVPLHLWHPTKCAFLGFILSLSLTVYAASVQLAESLHDDIEVCEALASLVKGCCSDVLFCSETVTNHHLPTSDREPCDALLHHICLCPVLMKQSAYLGYNKHAVTPLRMVRTWHTDPENAMVEAGRSNPWGCDCGSRGGLRPVVCGGSSFSHSSIDHDLEDVLIEVADDAQHLYLR
jgi:hypothetical protein